MKTIPNVTYTGSGMGLGPMATLTMTRIWRTCWNWRRLKLKRKSAGSKGDSRGDKSEQLNDLATISKWAMAKKKRKTSCHEVTRTTRPSKAPTNLKLETKTTLLPTAWPPYKSWLHRRNRKSRAKWRPRSQMNSQSQNSPNRSPNNSDNRKSSSWYDTGH